MKAVIYARFSSEKQNEASIEGQLRECLEYANFNGIEVIGNYIDRAQSAKTDHRPEFQRMIKDSYKRPFDCILVWKLDRFARNRYDSAYYKNVLKKNGVRVISAKESISQGADGILLEAILEGYAEYYSAELSEKVKRGMTENALKAKSNGVRPPFGYYVDDTDHYQIDETFAPIVREIFTRYLDGRRVNDIVKLLNERGIKHKGFEMKYNAVFRILTNRKYIGEYKFGDIVIPNAIPAIIDEATFNSVQQRMARNKKAPAMHRSEDDYLLTTRLFCGKCGAMMTGVIGTSHTSRQYRYYKCNHAKQGKCDKKFVRKEWLEELVLDEIKELLSSDEVVEELADRVYELQQQEDNAVASIQTQLTGVETKLNNLVEAIAQGIYSSATKKALDELEERKRNLEIELFEAQMRNPVLTKEQILFALHNFRKIDISTQEGKQRLIDGFVNSIYLYDDHFVITYNYKGQSKTVTFEEVNSSPLTSKGSPRKTRRAFSYARFAWPLQRSGEPGGFVLEELCGAAASPRWGHQLSISYGPMVKRSKTSPFHGGNPGSCSKSFAAQPQAPGGVTNFQFHTAPWSSGRRLEIVLRAFSSIGSGYSALQRMRRTPSPRYVIRSKGKRMMVGVLKPTPSSKSTVFP